MQKVVRIVEEKNKPGVWVREWGNVYKYTHP
jgi:hypothetical protein